VVPLADGLGSTIALVNSSGSLVTTYSYDPFGNTTAAGVASANPSQYTGPENEGNGLYFYRSRYYSPLLARFINEDPIRFRGGVNFYTYVFDSPTNLTDPSGNCPLCPGAAAGTTATAAAGTTATAAEVDAVVAPLVEGAATDMGLGATFGVAIETGSSGGPIGVAVVGAGAAGWGIGRLVGNMPMPGGGGATVDDGWTGIWSATLFKPDPDPLPGATPLLKNLAGRQCKKGDVDDCVKRFHREINWCTETYKGSIDVYYEQCIARARARLRTCLDGLPDPGVLDPMDPNWSND
jgi:RHS repeat-associated protein